MTDSQRTSRSAVVALVRFGLATAVTSCGGGDLTLPVGETRTLAMVSGQDQVGTVGAALGDSLVIRITDHTGTAIAGVEVAWNATGGGSVSPAASVTDTNGLAATERVLGTTPGSYATTVTAPVADGSPATFQATASADAPSGTRSVLNASDLEVVADNSGEATMITVTVRDRLGNPVPDATVVLAATGGGNTLKQPGRTDDQGVATGSFSSTATGMHIVSAKANGVTLDETAGVRVTPAAADPGRSSATVPGGTAGAATTITVRLRDRFNNAITGARGQIDVGVSGANSAANLRIAEMDNGEYSTTYTPTKVGQDLVRITLDDATPFSSPFPSTVAAGRAAATTTIANVEGSATIFQPSVDVAIDARDAFNNPIRRAGENIVVTATHEGERRDVPMAYDPTSGFYVGTFRAWAVGLFGVEVLVGGTPVLGSPFRTTVTVF